MATVTAAIAGTAKPAGTVTFLDGASVIGTATLSNGTAALTTSKLSAATHTISARYEGDSSFGASSSSLVHGVVAATVQLVASATFVRTTAGTYVATVSIRNIGNSQANTLQLAVVLLNGLAGAPGAVTLGALQPGATVTTTQTFPASAGVPGSSSNVLRLQFSWTGGSVILSLRVPLP